MKTKIYSDHAIPISLIISGLFILSFNSQAQNANKLMLKDYRPVSIFRIPATYVEKAAFPAIDIHSHDYARTPKQVEQEVKNMDACGIARVIIMTQSHGSEFDSIFKIYSRYPDRFIVFCGLDYSGYDNPGYGPAAVKELERCVKAGAKGVGELMFKGKAPEGRIMLPDDPRLDAIYEKSAELKIPVNLHISEDKWMYERMDSTNDGMMNASKWQIRNDDGSKTHEEMLARLENVVKKHPKTIFIAAHLANSCADLSFLANLFDKYPNIFADNSARFSECATIPRYMNSFYTKYQDRLMYGTDLGFGISMYRITFRIMETEDEHFYEHQQFHYHWPLNGFGLSKDILKKVYHDNAARILNIN